MSVTSTSSETTAASADAAPANGKRGKAQVNKTTGKQRESEARDSPRPLPVSQRRDAVREGADPKQQDSRASEETKPYQDSGNPLHPSYMKK